MKARVPRRRRYTTSDEDAAYMLRRIADATRAWQPGDACLGYTNQRTSVVSVDDRGVATLADGTHCHRSHLRRLPTGGAL